MDIRIKRTKQMLENALFELMKDKPVEKITPTELCRKATVNRNTFYSHYSSVAELYESIENSLINSVNSVFEAMKHKSSGYKFRVIGALYGMLGVVVDNHLYSTVTGDSEISDSSLPKRLWALE